MQKSCFKLTCGRKKTKFPPKSIWYSSAFNKGGADHGTVSKCQMSEFLG